MRNSLLFLLMMFSLGGNSAHAENDITGAFVYPNAAYSPECINYCKENKIDTVYIWAEYFKRGLAGSYKEAGLNAICGKMLWQKMYNLKPDEMQNAFKKWITENVGENEIKNISGFEIDEPFLGYGDWDKERLPDLDTDNTLKEIYLEKFKRQAFSHLASDADRQAWRNLLSLRQKMFFERLAALINVVQKNYPDKSMTITLTPAIYESGPNTGVDINILNNYIPQNVKLTVDPYFQAFRRPLQWSGMIIKHFRCAMNERKLGGVTQFYDVIKHSGWPSEGYVNFASDDSRRQVFEYLMNGSTDISTFVLSDKIGTPEDKKVLGESMRFVKQSEKYWSNTKQFAQVGIYFSENTSRMLDMWGPWSKMTGLYGASFQTEWTYYNLSSLHVPADIVSMAFNEENGLLEKLKKYPVMILPDVKCMSQYETDTFTKYVAEGGIIIATGETSSYNANGEALGKPSMANLMGIKNIEKTEQNTLSFAQNSLIPEMKDKTLSFDGNASLLFKKQATRHPQWLKDKCIEKKHTGYDIKFAEKIPAPYSLKITPAKADSVIAAYPDKSAAVIMNQVGNGKCVYIAPSDLVLFKGNVTDSLERPENPDKSGSDFFAQLLDSCIGQGKFINYSGPDGVEVSVRYKEGEWYLFLLNHNAAKPAENVKLSVNIPSDKITGISIFDQVKCSEEKLAYGANKKMVEMNVPSFQYGVIIKINRLP